MKLIGATTATSKDFEYVLCEESSIFPCDQFTMDLIDAANNKTSENDFPKFIHYKDLKVFVNKIRKQDLKKTYASATPKAAKAMQIFDKLVLKLEKRMSDKNYSTPIVEAPLVKANRTASDSIDVEGINQFFDYVATQFEKYQCIDERDPKEFRDALNSTFQGSWDFDGLVGLRLPLAVAIAISVFLDENSTILMVFARDRWEYSGERGRCKPTGFCFDSKNREGVVF